MDEQSISRRVVERAPMQGQASPESVAARIEEEIARLRKKHPALGERLDRAANLVVTHLACPRPRVIRVRVSGGRPRLLVRGSGGAVYVVDPADWSCSCPDSHRRGKGCKHALGCFVLARASRPAPKLPACAGCEGRFPHAKLVEVRESLTFHEGDLLCTPCWFGSDAEVL